MNISKEEFQDWKTQHVTKAVFASIADRISDAKDVLSVSAGVDSLADREVVGMIRAFNELLSMDWEGV